MVEFLEVFVGGLRCWWAVEADCDVARETVVVWTEPDVVGHNWSNLTHITHTHTHTHTHHTDTQHSLKLTLTNTP